jgi:hypothetical protein
LLPAQQLALADAHVSMRVHHSSWLFTPNYGVLQIAPALGGEGQDAQRPVLKGVLYSKDKVIERDLQYSIQGGMLAETCHGCKCSIQ